MNFRVRMKREVRRFLEIGAEYYGVGFQTYLQWLLERALLDEIHYYGWETRHTLSFDRQRTRDETEHHGFIHLDRISRSRLKKDSCNDPPETHEI